jgi:hypothetical protein
MKILVPLEKSDFSETVLFFVKYISKLQPSDIVLAQLASGSEKVKADFGSDTQVETVQFTGDPAEQLVKYSEKNKVGLVVMSPGDAASEVLRSTPSHFLLARGNGFAPIDSEKPLKMLVPLDTSQQDGIMLSLLKKFTSGMKAEFTFFQTLPPEFYVSCT